MHMESGTNLLELPKEAVKKWLQSFDVVLSDCDGVLWHESKPISGSPDTINALQKLGKRVYFATNNGIQTRHAIWERANSMDFQITEEQILCPNHCIIQYLKDRDFQQTVYVAGAPAISEELNSAGIATISTKCDVLDINVGEYIQRELQGAAAHNIGAVVVGFDENFTYGKMMKASHYLGINEQCLFLATNPDAVHRYPLYHIPGTGAILKGIETCVGREALCLGKPNPMFCESLVKKGLLIPERTLMIGDCYKVDVAFGKNCGFQTLLVGSGAYNMQDVLKLRENPKENQKLIPDFYLEKLGDLLQFL